MFRIFSLEQRALKLAKKREAKERDEKIVRDAITSFLNIDARMKQRPHDIAALVQASQKRNEDMALHLSQLDELKKILDKKIDSPWILCELSTQNSTQFRIELSFKPSEELQDLFNKLLDRKLVIDIRRSEDFNTAFVYFNLSDLDYMMQKAEAAENICKPARSRRYFS